MAFTSDTAPRKDFRIITCSWKSHHLLNKFFVSKFTNQKIHYRRQLIVVNFFINDLIIKCDIMLPPPSSLLVHLTDAVESTTAKILLLKRQRPALCHEVDVKFAPN